jgi:mono/diheme cytochrome c family protein
MMKPVPLATSLFLLSTLVACGKDAPPPSEEQATAPASTLPGPADILAALPHDARPYGLDVYTAKCASCHGDLGQGVGTHPGLKNVTRAAMYQKLLDYRTDHARDGQAAIMAKAVAGLDNTELAAASVYAGE